MHIHQVKSGLPQPQRAPVEAKRSECANVISDVSFPYHAYNIASYKGALATRTSRFEEGLPLDGGKPELY
jgi:hypothetical protein